MAELLAVEVDDRDALAAIRAAPRALRHAIKEELLPVAKEFTERFKRESFTGSKGRATKNRGRKLRDLSGKLRRSFKPFVVGRQTRGRREQTLGEIQAGVRSRAPHAHLHMHSNDPSWKSSQYPAGVAARIKPQKSEYLAIPMKFARTASGKQKASAKDWNNTHVRRSRKGGLIIWGPKNPKNVTAASGRGRRQKLVPLFALVKEAEIPARLRGKEVMVGLEDEWYQALVRGVGTVSREWQSARSAAREAVAGL